MPKRIKRSTFLKGLLGLSVASASGKYLYDQFIKKSPIKVQVLGPSKNIGHLLRDGQMAKSQDEVSRKSVRVLIVGGGIAGLSCAWWLDKNGFGDIEILELEDKAGGNSSSGQNQISAYPWGAHYVPLANHESVYVREFFNEFGVIKNNHKELQPEYNELFLCHDPEERLFKDGSYQEGLVPNRGLQPEDKKEIERFFEIVLEYRNKIGSDGRPAFAIPLELSSKDSEFVSLDTISMATWVERNNFKSKPLLWYINYCSRDDYGATIDNISAWAGIHYFAGRRGQASNAEQNSVVTWPEGNGFIVDKLKEKLGKYIKTNSCTFSIEQNDNKVLTHAIDTKTRKVSEIESDYVVFAAPRFISKYIIRDNRECQFIEELSYPPWMTANIELKKIPYARGISSAWDNVRYNSESLGYVVATHQNITTKQTVPTVITYYYPMSEFSPSEARQKLDSASASEWKEIILRDLGKMHANIEQEVVSIDLWPWGHGMISPTVGYIWGNTREAMKEPLGRVFFAHSDISGISNFEESQYRGVVAAQDLLARLGA